MRHGQKAPPRRRDDLRSSNRCLPRGSKPAEKHPAEYRAWGNMKYRCLNPRSRSYHAYGGRGITVCERWANSFLAFLADMGPRPSEKHSIDRIDNDGNYEPGNCRWATVRQQHEHKRDLRLVQYRGESMPLKWAAQRAGLPYETVHARLRKGWNLERALSEPLRADMSRLARLRAGVRANA